MAKNVRQVFALKDYEREAVPEQLRYGWWDISSISIGFAASMAAFMIGMTLGLSFVLSEVIGILIFAALFLGIVDTVSSIISYRTGLTWGLAGRRVFGRWGSFLPVLTVAAVYIGFQGFNLTWAPDYARDIWGWPFAGFVLLSGIIYGLSAYIGFDALKLVSKFSVYLFIAAAVWLIIASIREVGWSQIAGYAPENPLPVSILAAAVIGQWLAASTTGSFDVNRYANSIWTALISTWTSHVVRVIIIASGFFGAIAFQAAGPAGIAAQFGLPAEVLGLILIFLVMWTTSDNAAYSASLSVSGILPGLTKKHWVVIIMVFGTIMAIVGVLDHFVGFLTLIGSVVPPVPGILIATFMILPLLGVRPDIWNVEEVEETKIEWMLVAIWAICSALGYYLGVVREPAVPYVPIWILLLSMILTVVVSLVVHRRETTPARAELA